MTARAPWPHHPAASTSTKEHTMAKGQSKTGSRSGSDSNNASRASASDRRQDRSRVDEGKAVKLGSDNSGKLAPARGSARRRRA
jgi:hypothetical protein